VAKKYTRKQLKKPDEFINFSIRAWSFLRENAPYALLTLGVAAVIIAGAWIWTHFSTTRAVKTTAMMTRALEIYHQNPMAAAENLASEDDGIPRFKNRAEKLAATTEELSKVVTGGGRSLGSVARAMRAGVYYDAGKYQEACADFEKLLQKKGENRFLSQLIEDTGYCYEALRDWDKALQYFRMLPQEGEKRYWGRYHEARILAKKGQVKDAVSLYQQIVNKVSSGWLLERASDQLAMLESQ